MPKLKKKSGEKPPSFYEEDRPRSSVYNDDSPLLYFSKEKNKLNDALLENFNVENLCETPKIRYDTLNVTKRDSNLEIIQKKDGREGRASEKDLESLDKCQQEIEKLKGIISQMKLSIDLSIGDLKLEIVQNNRKVEALKATLEEVIDILRNRIYTPPLPPPLPPPPLLPQANATGAIRKNSTLSKAKKEPPRPVISLDDILKVKLKKPSESTVATKRSTGSQPEVTQEMLKQVKLKKRRSRSLTPTRLPSNSPEGSKSPHSRLQRLFKGSVLKRLRRIDGQNQRYQKE